MDAGAILADYRRGVGKLKEFRRTAEINRRNYLINSVADRAKAAGVTAKLEVWPEMIHVWQLFASFLPEGQQAIDGIGGFLKEHTA
jgi:acetyl esterase/lipase